MQENEERRIEREEERESGFVRGGTEVRQDSEKYKIKKRKRDQSNPLADQGQSHEVHIPSSYLIQIQSMVA